MAFTTQARIENILRLKRLIDWANDGTGSVDPDVINSAIDTATEDIRAALLKRYGSQVNLWDINSVPEYLKNICDYLSVYYLAIRNNAISPVIELYYETNKEKLDDLVNMMVDLPGISDYSDNDVKTDNSDSVFDDYDKNFNEGELICL